MTKETTVSCDRCDRLIKPPTAIGAREIALNVMNDDWEIAGGQEPIADLCAPCVARLRGWVKEPPSLEDVTPKRKRRR